MKHMRLCALDTIHHAAFNKTAKCTSLLAPKYTLKYTPDCNRLHTPCLLDLRSQLSSQDAPKYTPGHALKDAPNCTQWHPPSLLDYTLPSKLTKCSHAHSQSVMSTVPSDGRGRWAVPILARTDGTAPEPSVPSKHVNDG
jgi:hypothetical protein